MATPKKKVDAAPLLSSWDEADATLAQIAELTARISAAESAATKLKEEATKLLDGVAADVKRRKELEKNLQGFCEAQLPTMPQKSRKLNHGVIAFTASKECQVRKGFTVDAALNVMKAPLADALAKLADKLSRRYVRVKTEIDKALALADFNAGKTNNAKLAELGLEVVDKDNFSYSLPETKAQPTT